MPFTQTFPNGQTLTSSALAIGDINSIFQSLTAQLFGLMVEQGFACALVEGDAQVTIPGLSGVSRGFAVTDQLSAYGIAAYGSGGYGAPSVIPAGTTVTNVAGDVITLSNPPTSSVAEATLFFTNPASDTMVRLTYPTTGQPTYGVADDLAFVTCKEVDDWYNKVPDEVTYPNDDVSAVINKEYTRVWRVFWEVRGPNSYQNASILKTAMQLDFAHDTLAAFGLYLVPNVGNPQRVPEQWGNQWFERVDLGMHFNEQVNESIEVPLVASVEVTGFNNQGQQFDLEITGE